VGPNVVVELARVGKEDRRVVLQMSTSLAGPPAPAFNYMLAAPALALSMTMLPNQARSAMLQAHVSDDGGKTSHELSGVALRTLLKEFRFAPRGKLSPEVASHCCSVQSLGLLGGFGSPIKKPLRQIFSSPLLSLFSR
jgi:hypothetical protein